MPAHWERVDRTGAATTQQTAQAPATVEKIVFVSRRDGASQIYIMNTDGSEQQRLTNSGEAFTPAISPDGTRILFNSTGNGNAEIWVMLLHPATFSAEIHVMNSDGSGDAAITQAGATSEYPCWSPDGKQIAFQTSQDGNFEIYIMNADGSDPRRLTYNDAFDGRPSWGSVIR